MYYHLSSGPHERDPDMDMGGFFVLFFFFENATHIDIGCLHVAGLILGRPRFHGPHGTSVSLVFVLSAPA